jgi:Polyketide cyclase / dehydrase and lipid transport
MRRGLPLALSALLLPAALAAAELRKIAVDHEGEVYSVDSVVWFDAPRDAVYAVFADWDLSPQFSSAIVEAHDIEALENGRPGFYVKNRGCFLFFCRTVVRQGAVTATPDTVLEATADPGMSDFSLSEERWRFRSAEGGTLVNYSLRMTPSFWVPPLIGPYVIKRKLRDDGAEALDRIEAIAQARAAERG